MINRKDIYIMPYILKAGQVESKDNKTELISEESTHEQYPSAKAVYEAVSEITSINVGELSGRVESIETWKSGMDQSLNVLKDSFYGYASGTDKSLTNLTQQINKTEWLANSNQNHLNNGVEPKLDNFESRISSLEGVSQAGAKLLCVVFDTDNIPSHTFNQVESHISSGGVAIGFSMRTAMWYSLDHMEQDTIWFRGTDNELNTYLVSIDKKNKGTLYELTLTDKELFDKEIERLDDRINEVPLTYVESPDANGDIVCFRDLKTGMYVLKGTFRPYYTCKDTISFGDMSFFANIMRGYVSDGSHHTCIQAHSPYQNMMRHYDVTENGYTSKDIKFNDLVDLKTVEDMIGGAGGGSDGGSILVVNWEGEGYLASKTASQIYEHCAQGGTAILRKNGSVSGLINSNEGVALFCYYDAEDNLMCTTSIYTDGSVESYETSLATLDYAHRIESDMRYLRADIGLLVVQWDGVEGSQSSHIGEQIYDHIQDGGTAVLHNTESDEYFPLTWCNSNGAMFGNFSSEEGIGFGFEVNEDGNVWCYLFDTIGTDQNITIPQNWSIKEKQTARENIGAMSEEDVNNKIASLNGGVGLMLVQWDGADDLSHSYEEMIAHLLAGGNVILCQEGSLYYSLDHMDSGILWFIYTGEDYVNGMVSIDPDGIVQSCDMSMASAEALHDAFDQLTERIDNINTSGGSITVDDALSYDSTNPVQNKVVYNEISQIGQTATYARNQLEKDVVPRLEQVESSIGNIQSVLDTIIATQENIIGKITFTVGGNSYEAVNGMTWGEWVNTRYNIDGFNSVTGGWIVTHENFFVTDPSYNNVTVDSVIKNNYKYMLD